MDKNKPYFKQATLLMQILPDIAEHDCFALKGGTAINLFVRDLPRLSVDIDLVYLPIADRETSLTHIDNELRLIENKLRRRLPGVSVVKRAEKGGPQFLKFVVQHEGASVKVEVSSVLRGAVFESITMDVSSRTQEMLGFASMKLVSFEDLFAGKLCAALDRQHPRDLFDVKLLFENEGITNNLFRTFIVYLISSNRPIAELLRPNLSDLKQDFVTDFNGMTFDVVSLEDLKKARERLISSVHSKLEENDKNFLLSFKQGSPQWNLLGLEDIEKLPAVLWKIHNLKQMNPDVRRAAIEKLEKVLYG